MLRPKDGIEYPSLTEDYVITLEPLEGLEPEVIEGI